MSDKVRVLIVDDSAFARKTLRAVLSGHHAIEVVGIARDGLEALEKIVELRPDVVTLDLVMPNLDGLGVLRAMPAEHAPRVVLVSITDANSELAVSALQLGAFDLVQKPTALATDRLYELNDELIKKVLEAGRVRRVPSQHSSVVAPVLTLKNSARMRLLVIGASTGGPQAITRLLSALPANFPVPIAIALHIPAGYTDALAARLHEQCALDVAEAREGMLLRPGLAILAQGGQHLRIGAHGEQLRAHVSDQPRDLLYYPSVNVLFESAARATADRTMALVLTGMGDDGCSGAATIRSAGGTILTEDESSCVVYGMPRCVVEAGLSTQSAPLERLAELIASYV
jgi:two-component system chemotaxis response regulator CheB